MVTPPGSAPSPRPAERPGFLKRVWRSERPAVAVPRDLILVSLVLALIVGSIWAYSGQAFPSQPPLVVVESGSMMHPDSAFGRVGTIDAGDLVIVRDVRAPEGIATAYGPPGRTGYGGFGDAIVYRPMGAADRVPIIHRAMTWVEVTMVGPPGADPVPRYSYWNAQNEFVELAPSVSLPEIGIHEMRPPRAGFVTKGDNPDTNRAADQVTHIPGRLVEADWVIGAARGEIPWLGLVKLSLTGNNPPPDLVGHCKVLRGWGPCDAWVMLGAALLLLILVPLALEAAHKRSETLRRWTA